MAKRLTENINSSYVAAASKLGSKRQKRKIVAYVEGYTDVLFWRNLLNHVESDEFCFQVMLPSRQSLQKGKKSVLRNMLGPGFGRHMIACVDADYDYLMQGATPVSKQICASPYVFHTIVYAIENFQCYAPTLGNVCALATLNDREVIDLESFMESYSRTIYPLFLWSVWVYRSGLHGQFSMADLSQVIALSDFNVQRPEQALAKLERKVKVKRAWLERTFPKGKAKLPALEQELQQLGVRPETTYLYVRGHDVFEKVVSPLVDSVSKQLRRQREGEIRRNAVHRTQYANELSGYQHAATPITELLQKHTLYEQAPLYREIIERVTAFVRTLEKEPNS